MEAARKAAGSTRIGELLKQPELREFLDPIIARMTAQYAESMAANPALPSLEAIDGGILSGEIAVCVYSHGPGQEPGVIFSIKPKDAKAFDTIINTAFKTVTHGQQDLPKDVPFPAGEGESAPGVMYSKGRLLLVKPLADMIAVNERINEAAKRSKGSLASNPNFKEAQAGMKTSAGWMYVNPAALIEIVEEQAAAKGNPDIAKIQSVVKAVGVDKLNSFLMGLTFEGGEPCVEAYIGHADDAPKNGLFSLAGTAGPSKALLQIAAPDAPYVAGASFNFGAVFPMVRTIVSSLDPNAGKQLEAGLAQISAMLQFDIEKDLLQNLDGDFVSAQTALDTSAPLSMSPGMVSVMHIKNPAKVEDCFVKMITFADAMKVPEKVPPFYVRYNTVTYKGTKIYYVSQLINGSFAVAVVKDNLLIGTSLNAAKRGIDQWTSGTNITSNKDFQSSIARVSGKPFDAEKLPFSFAYSTDVGSGGGMLLLTGLAITAETAAAAGIAEAVNQGKPLPPEPGGPDMFGLGELKSKAGGRAALNILNGMDLNRWPDEAFFVGRRQSHASVGMKTEKGWLSRSEFPPPMPHYGSAVLIPAVVAVVAAVAIPNLMRAKQAAQIQNPMINQIPPQAPLNAGKAAGAMNNLRQIHLAVTLYETDHNMLPTKASDLFPQYITDASVFKDPANPKRELSYTLITGVQSKDADALLAYEEVSEARAKNGRNVLKTDGSVEHLSDADFKQLLKETEEIVTKGGRKFGSVPFTIKDIANKK